MVAPVAALFGDKRGDGDADGGRPFSVIKDFEEQGPFRKIDAAALQLAGQAGDFTKTGEGLFGVRRVDGQPGQGHDTPADAA